MASSKIPKNPEIFSCEKCHYNTCSFKDYKKHLQTQKHARNTSATFSNTSATQKSPYHTCSNCGKIYSDRSGLWRHKKACFSQENPNTIDEETVPELSLISEDHTMLDDMTPKELILMLLKQNTELQKSLIDMSKQVTSNHSHNTTTTNSHNTTNNTTTNNNSFNLQFFLNETCKNAMNITDFANSIKLQLSDLISVGKLGYVEGISNIIVKQLNALDVTERPVHCTDKKRETFYIKDDNKWEKDEDDKKLKQFIKTIAFKNQKLFPQFKEAYPDYNNSESSYSDQYSKIVIEAIDDNNPEKESKIIKRISKAVSIDKVSLDK